MIKVPLNGSLHPLAGKSVSEMTALLNNQYSSVQEMNGAFIVSSEQGPILISWDASHNDWVGQPFQFTGGAHFLTEDGTY